MTQAAFIELLASADLLVDAAERCAKVTQTVLDAQSDGKQLPWTVLVGIRTPSIAPIKN